MPDADPARRTIDAYLAQVGRKLRGLSDADIAEITTELKSHILDRAGEAGALTPQSVEAAARALGDVRELARGYAAARIAGQIEERRSPWRVVRTAFRLMGVSIYGFFVLLGSIIGYAFALTFLGLALLKPIFPSRIGLWHVPDEDPYNFSLGWQNLPADHEYLGWWLIPICLGLGALCLWLTYRFGLASLRRLRRSARGG